MLKRIHKLPIMVANQIAAGEVVERPSSVIKELIENSLDASATRIDVELEYGGIKLIKVRDNGQGIRKDDLKMAFEQHATSKIQSAEDLQHIASLGFRGEALASIRSVSRLVIQSRPKSQEVAWQGVSDGVNPGVKITPVAHNVGTTVTVRDLFFNTPARRRFLKAERTEFGHVDLLLKRLSLSRFDVAFRWRHNEKIIKDLKACHTKDDKEARIEQVFGKSFLESAVYFEKSSTDFTLHGWVTNGAYQRTQNDQQCFFLNGRFIRDRLVSHALKMAYDGILPVDTYASYILFLTVNADTVDVNVHPTKYEVRFRESRLVHDFLQSALQEVLQQSASFTTLSDEATYASKETGYTVAKTAHWPLARQILNRKSERALLPNESEAEVILAQPNSAEVSMSLDAEKQPDALTLAPTQEADAVKALLHRRYALIETHHGYALMDCLKAYQEEGYQKFTNMLAKNGKIHAMPLLIPLSLRFSQNIEHMDRYAHVLETLGITFFVKNEHELLVKRAPQALCIEMVSRCMTELVEQHLTIHHVKQVVIDRVLRVLALFYAKTQLMSEISTPTLNALYRFVANADNSMQSRLLSRHALSLADE